MLEYIILAAIFSALPIIFIKKYLETRMCIYLFLAIISNLFLVYTYIKILDHADASTQYALVKMASIVLVAVYGLIILMESPPPCKIFGLFLSIGAVYFLA